MAFPTRVRNTLLFLILWRLMSVYVVRTSHVPDEYWQSLEVAHRLAFGYGYLTWEWRSKIRSYIYPFLISILYRILALASLDYAFLLINLPRVFQAALSGYADYRFYLWTRSKWALFIICTNWFWYYCAARTLSNSLETTLTVIALSIFPWPNGQFRDCRFLWIVGLITAIRPTAAIIWLPLCAYHICASPRKISILLSYCTIGSATLIYSILIDSLCYGSFVVTPWEFFRANVMNNVAHFYGIHHVLWYLFAGLPVILGLQTLLLPLAVLRAFGNKASNGAQILMIAVVCWTIFIYSILAHKEFRFILSLLPMLIYVCTVNFSSMFRITEYRRKILLGLFILTNLLPGFYICLIHQRGSLDIMYSLRRELIVSESTNKSLMFLTPCHATPLYSHLHVNVTVRFLTCEPNLENLPDYVDEADEFFKDPMTWLNDNNEKERSFVPDLLILFDNLSPRITPFLSNYRLLDRIFHAHFPQSNYGEYIELYRRK